MRVDFNHRNVIVGVLGLLGGLLATGSMGQATSDLVITYSFDEKGNRTKEAVTVGTLPADTMHVPTLSPTSINDTVTVDTTIVSDWPAATDNVTITPVNGTPPYVYQISYVSGYAGFTVSPNYMISNFPKTFIVSSTCQFGTPANPCSFSGVWQVKVTDEYGTSQTVNLNITQQWVYQSCTPSCPH